MKNIYPCPLFYKQILSQPGTAPNLFISCNIVNKLNWALLHLWILELSGNFRLNILTSVFGSAALLLVGISSGSNFCDLSSVLITFSIVDLDLSSCSPYLRPGQVFFQLRYSAMANLSMVLLLYIMQVTISTYQELPVSSPNYLVVK